MEVMLQTSLVEPYRQRKISLNQALKLQAWMLNPTEPLPKPLRRKLLMLHRRVMLFHWQPSERERGRPQ